MCNRHAEGIDLQVVREAPPPVDLDHRQPLPVGRLEGLVARDVDLPERVAELRLELSHLGQRPLAEMAPLRVVDDDLGGYG